MYTYICAKGESAKVSERERKRERERERGRIGLSDRERERGRERERERERESPKEASRHARSRPHASKRYNSDNLNRHTAIDLSVDIQTDRQTDRQTGFRAVSPCGSTTQRI
jgi:hypothetical protein